MFWISMACHGSFEAIGVVDVSKGAFNVVIAGCGGCLSAIGIRTLKS
jgi:hypothetical protein